MCRKISLYLLPQVVEESVLVEPSSSVAPNNHLLVPVNSSYSTACPGDTQTTTKSSKCSCGGARTSGETQLPRKKKADIFFLSSKPGLISEISGSGE